MASRHPVASAGALVAALTVFLTWPQALHMGTEVAAHDDPLFSIWRLAWVAHALRTDPRHLFDANIFYPHVRTLAYSDAMLFEGVVAAPLLWLHANPVFVYNMLLLGAIVSSGIGMFVLARHLTGDRSAAMVAAAVFTLLPYRVEHFMHLELQWTVWMPLTFWAVHRTVQERSLRFGVLTGALLSLQVLSALYYGAFLALAIAAFAVLLLAWRRELARPAAILPLAVGAIVATILTLPYALPYIENTRLLGARDPGEIANFSAQLDSFFVTPRQNWLWGWTAPRFTGDELHLFPGAVAIGLALLAVARRPRVYVWMYFSVLALTTALALGSHGALYRFLNEHLWLLRGFRAPARFSILSGCALAVLAGFGYQVLAQMLAGRAIGRWLFAIVVLVLAIECGSAPMILRSVSTDVPDVYKYLQTLKRSVIVEFPMVDYDLTPQFMYGSIFHWHWLVNGYSGYTPPDYQETRARLRAFPDDAAIARLRELHVQYIVVHQVYYKQTAYAALMGDVLRRHELIPKGRYRDWDGSAEIFELR